MTESEREGEKEGEERERNSRATIPTLFSLLLTNEVAAPFVDCRNRDTRRPQPTWHPSRVPPCILRALFTYLALFLFTNFCRNSRYFQAYPTVNSFP